MSVVGGVQSRLTSAFEIRKSVWSRLVTLAHQLREFVRSELVLSAYNMREFVRSRLVTSAYDVREFVLSRLVSSAYELSITTYYINVYDESLMNTRGDQQVISLLRYQVTGVVNLVLVM